MRFLSPLNRVNIKVILFTRLAGAKMNIFDIIGPCDRSLKLPYRRSRTSRRLRQLLESSPQKAEITLYNSFADTGAGHGTDRAIVGGLLGFEPDDHRLTNSFQYAAGQDRLTYSVKKPVQTFIRMPFKSVSLVWVGKK